MTASGPLREVIQIQEQTTTRDATGQPLLVWGVVGTRRAEKMATPGREVWTSNERVGRVPTVFRIRYPRDFKVTGRLRVVHLGVVYDVKSAIDRDGRRVDMLLTCDEIVGEAAL